jgi:hypothetical protein
MRRAKKRNERGSDSVQRRAYRRSGENEDIDEILSVRFLDWRLAACGGVRVRFGASSLLICEPGPTFPGSAGSK